MGQEQGYTNYDDFQVLEFFCSFYRVKSSSVGWNRLRMHFSNLNINSLSISAQGFLRMSTHS